MATPQDRHAESPTTFMIQNLPSRWPTEAIRRAIDENGFEGAYDFFYMPRRDRYGKSQSYGYAFINFIDHMKAQSFREAAESGALQFKTRLAKVVRADIQGVANLKAYFKSKNVMKYPAAPIFAGNMDIKQPGSSQELTAILPQAASEVTIPTTALVVAEVKTRSPSMRWCDIEDELDD
eukprot:TRINITY_DN9774_c0_g1_i2.p1 TRINITY_DN9774_c0_g1~~TRINITY_DN9774_c0_g1_i2.p1  ORF type:complete len:179 (-),score=36.76 TRINITY_DN9774_c0_g1_i2:691-1227(-)